MSVEHRFLQIAQLAAIAVVVVSCYAVLRPFIPAILLAIVVSMSTWPLYRRLRRVLGERSTPAALLISLLLVLLLIGPSALLATGLADNVSAMIDVTREFLGHGPIEPPPWLIQTPIIGERLHGYWQGLASGGEEAVALFRDLLEPARHFFIVAAAAIGKSLLQMVFAVIIGFFVYRDGETLIKILRNALTKLAGDFGEDLLTTIHHTVTGVVRGILGTALAQAIVAITGFLIAGVPGAFLLGAATFLLSAIPIIGPAPLWIGASAWLIYQESYGWAIFMVLWGMFAISSIDNVVRPYLISRGSSLPLLLVILGVFGGIAAFGFIGLFIGPPILAVALSLIRLWAARPLPEPEPPRQTSG